MEPLRSILAATDFSPHAIQAAQRASMLAAESGAALTLLNVLPRRPLDALRAWLGAAHPGEASLMAQAYAELERAAAALGRGRPGPAGRMAGDPAVHPGPEPHPAPGLDPDPDPDPRTHPAGTPAAIRTLVSAGPAVEEIQRAAQAVDAGLVVLGARGAGLLRRMALGTTAERLVRASTRPVLVARGLSPSSYRRALVAVDFSPWSGASIDAARQVAPRARLVLMTVFDVPFEGKLRFAGVEQPLIDRYRDASRAQACRHLEALAEQAGLPVGSWDACVVEGDPWAQILEQQQRRQCDLVVLGKHGDAFGEELLLGSVTSTVLAESDCDVLVSTARAP